MCSEELGLSEREKECVFVGRHGVCLSFVNSQCSQPSVYLFLNVSVVVDREEQPRMALGSWQDGRAGRASSCSWSEKIGQEVGNGVNGFTRVERSEGILDVKRWRDV